MRSPRSPLRRLKPLPDVRNAREAAFAVLCEYKHNDRFVSQLLDEVVARSPNFGVEQRPLAVELINGVVRREATLDALLRPHMQRPRHRVEGLLWTLLQIGVYQLTFLDAVPAYAAVNETVALAKKVGRRGWDGFVNGVLRAVERALTDQFSAVPGVDAIPVHNRRFRRSTLSIFADPSTDPIGYVTDAFSFPRRLVEQWHQRFDFDELCRIGFWFDEPSPVTVRVNPLKARREEVLAQLVAHNIASSPSPLPQSIRLGNAPRIESLPGFAEGLFTVQDETAMQAVDLLDPHPGESILDLCAAPGTKATQIAERMANRGTVTATDVHPNRLRLIEDNCRRLGIDIIRSCLTSRDSVEPPPGPFDGILVDVPCSNSGVLGKRPEARWRLNELGQFEELAQKQMKLLRAACRRVRPGGRVVYSTCSIEPIENEQVVAAVIDADSSMQLVSQRTFVPGLPGDGGYQALLVRKEIPAESQLDASI